LIVKGAELRFARLHRGTRLIQSGGSLLHARRRRHMGQLEVELRRLLPGLRRLQLGSGL
jgi:hypothetical protein